MKIQRGPAAEFLEKARNLQLQIDAAQEQIMRMRALAEKAVVGLCADMAVQDWRSELVLKIVDAEREMTTGIEELLTRQREAEALIGRIEDGRYRALLQLRYLAGLTWDQVAEKMGYEARQVYRLYRSALGEAEAAWKEG